LSNKDVLLRVEIKMSLGQISQSTGMGCA